MATASETGQGSSPKVDLMLQVGGDDGAKQCGAFGRAGSDNGGAAVAHELG